MTSPSGIASGPASGDLGVYVHIPFCERKCRYCAFYSVPLDRQDLPKFLNTILAELDLYAFETPVETLYLGGGSPSLLPQDLMIPFVESLIRRLSLIHI